jgi:hypothetical protein
MSRDIIVIESRKWSTWSNAAYAVAGLVVLLTNGNDYSIFFAFSLLTLAAGSGYYHASPTWPMVMFDFWGMFVVFGAAAGINTSIALGLEYTSLYVWIPIFLLMCFTAVYMSKFNVFISVGIYFAAAYLPLVWIWATSGDLLALSNWGRTAASGLLFLIALIIRQKGEKAKHAGVHNEGHAIWHFITGAASVLIVP